jgi:hypothetical protein
MRLGTTIVAFGAAAALPALALAPRWTTTPERPSPLAERAFERVLRRALDERTSWEQAWVVATAHYEVRTLESYGLTRNLADGLEQMFGVFQRVFGTQWAPGAPLKVWVFPSITAYNQFGEDHGAEHSSFYGSFYAAGHPERPVATYFCGDNWRLRQWITHSAAHQFMEGAFPGRQVPVVQAEALAAYFALYWDFPGSIERFEYLKSSGRFIPLAELLQTSLAGFADRPDDRLLELGVLMSYLLNLREDTRSRYDEAGVETEAPFAEYLRAALAGGDFAALPVHQLVTADADYLQDELFGFEFPR